MFGWSIVSSDWLFNRQETKSSLNGQHLSWENIKAGVPQGSIQRPLHKWSDWKLRLKSRGFCKWQNLIFIFNNLGQINSELSSDFTKIINWAYKWKMSFNPDYTKPAHKVVFSCKRSENRPSLMINNVPVKCVSFHKHLGLILDSKLDFNEHIDTMLSKVKKMIENNEKLYQELELESLQKNMHWSYSTLSS